MTGRNCKYDVIGTRPIRHDGVDKVTGRALYGADVNLPGLIFGKVLRSPHAHARIRRIDTSRAEAHPDVLAVVTAGDIAPTGPVDRGVILGQTPSRNVLAVDKVLYRGHPVAAVAAVNPHVAEEALLLVDVEYDPLRAVTNVEAAMEENAPILHENWVSDKDLKGSNVTSKDEYGHGDIDSGFSLADILVEREFRTNTVHQGYIEPQNATAWWPPDDRLTIWCSTQGHFGVRDNVSRILGIPVSDIRVIATEIGGGFGGKLSVYLEPVAAILSKRSGRPVKMIMERSEVFEATGPTSGSYIRVKMGVTNQGEITAADASIAFEAGAFPGAPVVAAAASVFAPYKINNVHIETYDVVDNKPKTTAYRAPGAPNVAYVTESIIDEIAEMLNIDPMKFRELNVAKEGTRRADGVMNGSIGVEKIIQEVMSHPHYTASLDGEWRGRGVGLGFCRNNSGMASAVLNVLPNGTVSLVEGSPDIGGTRTSLAQHVAEVLGIPVENIIPQVADTDTIGYTSHTGGSSVTFKSGWAAFIAAEDVKTQIIERVANIWDVPINQIKYGRGELYHYSDSELKISFKEVATLLEDTGGPVVGRANINPGGSSGSYSANIVDVAVDPDTGKVEILRFTAFQDVGTAVHPSYVEGQIQGGTSQGVGWALSEEYVMSDDGRVLNNTLLDYRMPTTLDLPMIEPVIVEVPNPGHPFGVRGVGEANISPPLAAIANAIYDATGVRIRSLPMKPQAVFNAIRDGI